MSGGASNRAVAAAGLLLACLAVEAPGGQAGGGKGCPWDLDGSGQVDVTDLVAVILAWDTDPGGPPDIDGDGRVEIDDLIAVILNWGACPEPARFFGHYAGSAQVTGSPFHPPGVYPAEVALSQTASGVVGFLNVTFDPQDVLGGTVTHTLSGRPGSGAALDLSYSDRACGAGDPIGLCYPHCVGGCVQYSFAGPATLDADELVLSRPAVLPELPYTPTLPFEEVSVTRTPDAPRDTFDGVYANLEYVWMGTVLFPLPLPLFGSNEVEIVDGQIVDWVSNGVPVPLAGRDPSPIIVAWCFDDEAGYGWMNQQGVWHYTWVLDPGGEGVSVFVTFAGDGPDCDALQDPLEGDGLDEVHGSLAGIMLELP